MLRGLLDDRDRSRARNASAPLGLQKFSDLLATSGKGCEGQTDRHQQRPDRLLEVLPDPLPRCAVASPACGTMRTPAGPAPAAPRRCRWRIAAPPAHGTATAAPARSWWCGADVRRPPQVGRTRISKLIRLELATMRIGTGRQRGTSSRWAPFPLRSLRPGCWGHGPAGPAGRRSGAEDCSSCRFLDNFCPFQPTEIRPATIRGARFHRIRRHRHPACSLVCRAFTSQEVPRQTWTSSLRRQRAPPARTQPWQVYVPRARCAKQLIAQACTARGAIYADPAVAAQYQDDMTTRRRGSGLHR